MKPFLLILISQQRFKKKNAILSRLKRSNIKHGSKLLNNLGSFDLINYLNMMLEEEKKKEGEEDEIINQNYYTYSVG